MATFASLIAVISFSSVADDPKVIAELAVRSDSAQYRAMQKAGRDIAARRRVAAD
jgi:hypothetical protein